MKPLPAPGGVMTSAAAFVLVLAAAPATAQPVDLNEALKSHDLLCAQADTGGELRCRLQPKAARTEAAAAAARPLAAAAQPPAASAAAPEPPAAPAPPAAAAAATQRLSGQAAFDALKSIGSVDLSVPDSPAFAVLGLSPSEIQRPGTVRELGTALIRSFGSDGKPRQGLALDFAPLPLFAPGMIVGGDRYRDDALVQALTRTTVSLATVDAGGGATQLAWGLRMGVIDRGDVGLYAREMRDCLLRSARPAPLPGGHGTEGPSEAELARVREGASDCARGIAGDLWARPALYVGFGQSWYSASGSLSDRSPAATAAWATYSIGRRFGEQRALLLLHAQRKLDDRVPDPADGSRLLRQDSSLMAARLRFGQERWHGFADLGRDRLRLGGAVRTQARHVGLGAEFKLQEDLWLQVAHTRKAGLVDGEAVRLVTAGVRFGSAPFLAAP